MQGDGEEETPKQRSFRFFERAKQLSLAGSQTSIEQERILKDLYKAISFTPNQINHYLFLGKLYRHCLDITSAIFCYRLVLNNAPTNVSAQKHLCELLVLRGQEIMVTAARISSKLKFHSARACFDEALAVNKENRQAWIFKCVCHIHAEELTDAFEAISRAFKTPQPITCEMLILRAKIYWGRGLTEQGNADIRIAATMDKTHPEVVSFYHRSFAKSEGLYRESVKDFTAGRYREALIAVNHAIHITTEDVKLLLMQSKIHRMLGELQDAYDSILRAKAIFEKSLEGTTYPMELPSDITLQINLILNEMSVGYALEGDYDKAILLLNRIIKSEETMNNKGGLIKPNHRFYVNRGDCKRALGELSEAIQDYSKAHEMHSDDWEIRTRLSLSHYLVATGYFNKSMFRETEAELNKAIHFNPKVSEYYVVRGKTRYYQSDFQKSYKDFKRALELNRDNDEVRELLAQFDDEVRSPPREGADPSRRQQRVKNNIAGSDSRFADQPPPSAPKFTKKVDFTKLPQTKEVDSVLKLRVTDDHRIEMMLHPQKARQLPALRMLGKSAEYDPVGIMGTSSPKDVPGRDKGALSQSLPTVHQHPYQKYSPFPGALESSQDIKGKTKRINQIFTSPSVSGRGPLWDLVETAKDIAWAKSHPNDMKVKKRLNMQPRDVPPPHAHHTTETTKGKAAVAKDKGKKQPKQPSQKPLKPAPSASAKNKKVTGSTTSGKMTASTKLGGSTGTKLASGSTTSSSKRAPPAPATAVVPFSESQKEDLRKGLLGITT